MVGDTEELSVTATANGGALRIVAGTTELGAWDLTKDGHDFRRDGLYLRDGVDELVFVADDHDGFVKAMRAERPRRPPRQRPRLQGRSWLSGLSTRIRWAWDRIPTRYQPLVVGALALFLLGLLWLWVLVLLFALVFSAILLAGIATALDPYLAVKLPERVSPALLLGVGLGGLALLTIGALLL